MIEDQEYLEIVQKLKVAEKLYLVGTTFICLFHETKVTFKDNHYLYFYENKRSGKFEIRLRLTEKETCAIVWNGYQWAEKVTSKIENSEDEIIFLPLQKLNKSLTVLNIDYV